MSKTFNPISFCAALLVAALLAGPASPAPERGTDSVGLATAAHTPATPAGPNIFRARDMADEYGGLSTLTGNYRLEKGNDSSGEYLKVMENSSEKCKMRGSISCTYGSTKYELGWRGLLVTGGGSTICEPCRAAICLPWMTRCHTIGGITTAHQWQ